MFAVSHGDTKSFLLWVVALTLCFGAATTLLIRFGCDRRTRSLLMVLGYTIAGFSILFLPLLNRDTIRGWNVQGLIATFSLFSLSLTEAYFFLYYAKTIVRGYETPLQYFWVIANGILLPAPVFLSIILFSPIHLNLSKRLGLVYLTPLLVFFRSCLAACGYASVAFKMKPSQREINHEGFPERAAMQGVTTESAVAKYYSIFRNTARISTMESVVLLACSVTAKWWFGPDYVLVLAPITTVSRSYIAYKSYESNGPSSTNDAAERKASSASSTIFKN